MTTTKTLVIRISGALPQLCIWQTVYTSDRQQTFECHMCPNKRKPTLRVKSYCWDKLAKKTKDKFWQKSFIYILVI